jgi:hypothetical protein
LTLLAISPAWRNGLVAGQVGLFDTEIMRVSIAFSFAVYIPSHPILPRSVLFSSIAFFRGAAEFYCSVAHKMCGFEPGSGAFW